MGKTVGQFAKSFNIDRLWWELKGDNVFGKERSWEMRLKFTKQPWIPGSGIWTFKAIVWNQFILAVISHVSAQAASHQFIAGINPFFSGSKHIRTSFPHWMIDNLLLCQGVWGHSRVVGILAFSRSAPQRQLLALSSTFWVSVEGSHRAGWFN